MKFLQFVIIILLASCTFEKGSVSSQSVNHHAKKMSVSFGKRVKTRPSKKLIKCSQYCSVNLLKQVEKEDFNYLAFENFGFRGIGRCRGHALLTQKLIYLAQFDPSAGCDLNELECVQSYRDGINKILNFKTHTFKGFQNIYEFSDHPTIAPILRGIVAGTSSRFRAGNGKIVNQSYKTPQLNTFHEIKRRVELGEMPYVGVQGLLTGAHAVLVYKSAHVGAHSVLCVKDPNYSSGTAQICEHYFYILNDEVYFKRADKDSDKMTFFSLTNDEERRVVKYKSALKAQCIRESKAAKLCK